MIGLGNKSQKSAQRGVSSLEAIVAFTLLTSVLSVSLPLIVRHGRLLMDQRGYRVALDELSNQLDRLTALPESQVQAAMQAVKLSDFAAARLPGGKLSGAFDAGDVGGRVTLRLSWGGHVQRAISMAAWVIPRPQQPDEGPTSEASP